MRTLRARLAARRGARRHHADVRRDRGCPDDGRLQGHRHPVEWLPQRPGLREQRVREPISRRARTGQRRATITHHPDVRRSCSPRRRSPEEGGKKLRSLISCTTGVLARTRSRIEDRRFSGEDATLAESVNDLLPSRLVKWLPVPRRQCPGWCWAPSQLQTCVGSGCLRRSTRSEQYIQGTPRSTRCMRAPPQSRPSGSVLFRKDGLWQGRAMTHLFGEIKAWRGGLDPTECAELMVERELLDVNAVLRCGGPSSRR